MASAWAAPEMADRREEKRRRWLVMATVGAACLALPSCGPVSTHPATYATDVLFVSHAAQVTLAQPSAILRIDATEQVPATELSSGITVQLHGSGQLAISSHAMEISITGNVSGQTLRLRAMYVGGDVFEDVVSGEEGTRAVTGRDWVELPLSAAVGMTAQGPLAALQLCRLHGDSVRPLGTRTLEGRETWGYSVTANRAEVLRVGSHLWRLMGLTPSELTRAKALVGSSPPSTTVEWFDSSGLVRQVRFAFDPPGGVGMQMEMNFVHYGAPVQITAPPPGDVGPFANYLHRLLSSGY
jgi:hypothetical protein